MKQFTASILIAVIVINGLLAKEILQGSSEQPSHAEHHADYEGYYFSSDLLNPDSAITSEEQKTSSAERLYPSIARYNYSKVTTAKAAENIRRNIQSDYIFFAELHVIRFEGADIIHPYYYSW